MKWFKKDNEKKSNMAQQQAKALKVSEHLLENTIFFYSHAATKQEVLASLVKRLPYLKHEEALKAILEREKAGSTVIAPGISLPHARMPDLSDIIASLAICSLGIKDGESGPSIQIFLLFLGPTNSMKKNLDFLASVSYLFQTENFKETLLQLTQEQDVLKKIRELEK